MIDLLILGLIQGLAEFLPISSSSHVMLFEKILDITESPGFAGAIHLATALSAIVFFWNDIIKIFKSFISNNDLDSKKIGTNIIFATIPAIIGALIVKLLGVDENLNNLTFIGFSAIFFGIVLYLTNKFNSNTNSEITNLQAFFIGITQIIAAIFPGASRSGVTLSTSFFMGVERMFAGKFVFLISIPMTILAGFYEIIIKKSIIINIDFFISFIIAFLSGLISIKIFFYLLKSNKLNLIVIYRIIFGIICIYLGFN